MHVHPDHDHLRCLLPLGATGERTGLNRGKLPSSYQVTLDGLGKATATQHWQVSPQATLRNRVSRRLPESQPTTGQHQPSMTLSSGMAPDVLLAEVGDRLAQAAILAAGPGEYDVPYPEGLVGRAGFVRSRSIGIRRNLGIAVDGNDDVDDTARLRERERREESAHRPGSPPAPEKRD